MSDLRSPFAPGFTALAAEDLAAHIRVLTDPHRLRILGLLGTEGPFCGVELQHAMGDDLKQPTISHHLRVLDEAGLITSKREGRIHLRRLNADRLRELSWLLLPGGRQ